MKDKMALVYVSEDKKGFDKAALEDLETKAAKANRLHQITGYLYYDKGMFLQYIEGPSSRIEQLFANIANDSRHEIISFMKDKSLENYRFLSWHMRSINMAELQKISMEALLARLLKNSPYFLDPEHEEMNTRVWRMMDFISNNQWRIAK